MFKDNGCVVISFSNLYVRLQNTHNILLLHWVREAITSKYVKFILLSGKKNPTDILSKHWAYLKVYPLLHPLLF